MRIKSGFVSNSSTCSFVLVGWRIGNKITHEQLADFFEIAYVKNGDDWDLIEKLFYMGGDEPLHRYDSDEYLGIQLAYSGCNDYLEDMNISISELQDNIELIKDLAERLGLDTENARVFSGTFSC